MIAKITTGSGFRGTLDYLMNEKKERAKKECKKNQKADEEKSVPEFAREDEMEGAPPYREGKRHRLIGGNMSGQTPRELAREFGALREQRPDISTPVHHVSISAKKGEKLTVEQWQKIAAKYINKMGFGNSAYVVVQHRDAEHNGQLRDHIHILTSRVDVFGKVVSEWQSKRRAEEVMREVEREYNLERVPSSHETIRAAPTRGEMEKFARSGEMSTRMQLQDTIDRVTADASAECPLPVTEFVERLERAGVRVNPNLQRTGRMSGVVFERTGVVMKGSDLGKGYAWPGLLKRGLEYDLERDRLALMEAKLNYLEAEQTRSSGDANVTKISARAEQLEELCVTLEAERSARQERLSLTLTESNRSQPQRDGVLKDQVVIGFQTYVAQSVEEAALARHPEITRDAITGYKRLTGEELSSNGRANFARLIIECEEKKPTDIQLNALKTLAEKGSPVPLVLNSRLDAADLLNQHTIAQGGESLWTRTALLAENQSREAKRKNTPAPRSDVGIRLESPGVDNHVAATISIDSPLARKKSAGREEIDVYAVNLAVEQIYDPGALLDGTTRGDARMGAAARALDDTTTSRERASVLAGFGYTAEVRRQDGKAGDNREIVVYDKAAIHTIETKLTPDEVKERLAGDGRVVWTRRAESLRAEAARLPTRTVLGEEIATGLELDNKEHKLEAILQPEQGDIRRYKVKVEDGKTRRLSVHDVEMLAGASAGRHVNRQFDAAYTAEQMRPRKEQRSAAVLRMTMLEEARLSELERQKDVIAAIRDKHDEAVARVKDEHSAAQAAYIMANEHANLIRRDYELRGEEVPAPIIESVRLDDLEIAAVDRAAIDSLKTIEAIRTRQRHELLEQGIDASDPRANRSDESAACLVAQTRLGELREQMSDHALQNFEESYWTRRVEIEGHDRNSYLQPATREEADVREKENKPEHKWSLSDVTKAIRTAGKTQSWLNKNAEFFEKRASIGEFIKQQLNPLNELRGTANWLINPKETLVSHLNLLNAVVNDPMVRGVRFMFDADNMKNQAKACRELIQVEEAKAAKLRDVIEGEVSAKLDAQGAELQSASREAREMRETLKEIVSHETDWREAVNQKMPKPKFEVFELRRIEANAMAMQDGKLLREYEGYAVEAKNQKMLGEENLPGRAVARMTVAETRVLEAQARIDMLDKPIGNDGLTARDITRVKVQLPEGREQLMSLQDATAAPKEVQAAVRDALEGHVAALQSTLSEAKEFHQATQGIVKEYEAYLKVHKMKLPKAQFNVKEHLEVERFAARVESDELSKRFGEISDDALRGGRVIGIEKIHIIAVQEYDEQRSMAQTIEASGAPQATALPQKVWDGQALNRSVMEALAPVAQMGSAEQTATTPANPSAAQSLQQPHNREAPEADLEASPLADGFNETDADSAEIEEIETDFGLML